MKKVVLVFDTQSIQRPRAIQAITDGLARNKFIEDIRLCRVPEQMKTAVKHKLCNSSVTFYDF